jgi:hypothetical protein
VVAFITCIRRLNQFDSITLFACISNFMKYYLGTCEYKWTHKNHAMEQIWIRRELGDDLYRTVEENNWNGCYCVAKAKLCQVTFTVVAISM